MIDSCTPDLFTTFLHPPIVPVGEAYARSTDPQTSHEAAAEVRDQDANAMEKVVLACIRHHPEGQTNHDICANTGLSWNTATPRVRPLVNKGLIRDSGERRVGPSNRRCIVWKAI